MGIIALALFTGTKANLFEHLPRWMHFLRTPRFEAALWVKIICALTMALGMAAGGWRIIRTVGTTVFKMQKVHGIAAQTSAAALIHLASFWGMPVSTTHVISSAVMGVGSTKGLGAVKWTVVERMVWAWLLTIPVSGIVAFALVRAARELALVP